MDRIHTILLFRCVCGVWMLASLILTQAYSGTLKAYLTNPGLTAPIGTVDQLLESGLSWEMVLYGEDVETELSESEAPVLKAFWDEKVIVPHESKKDLFHRVSINRTSILFNGANTELTLTIFCGQSLA